MVAFLGIAAQSAYNMVLVPKCHFSFFPPLGLWSGNSFMIDPFPDNYLLVLLSIKEPSEQ